MLRTTKSRVLIVDPYADHKALTDFAVTAPEGALIQLLADKASYKPSLKPAAEHWVRQFGQGRPLEVRLAAARTLHDRLIVIDGVTVWMLGQSFNALAERAHTSVSRMTDLEAAALKAQAYESMWAAAELL